ncbi:MAG: hypothetical protein MRY21_04195 [Simkaniaceae bacterium]|nr:hypothetical protein [Simkaniaceae bacterium]
MRCCGNWQRDPNSDRWTNTKSGEKWNGQTKGDIRCKFGLNFFGAQILTGVACQLPFQFADMFSGGFVRRGKHAAELEWRADMFNKGRPIQPGQAVPFKYILKHTLKELAITISKIALFPLYLVARLFLAFYGMCDPLNGRMIYSKLEHLMAVRQNGLEERKLPCLFFQYSAPCMQSHDNNLKVNNFRDDADYNRNATRSLIRKCIRFIEGRQKGYFKEHGAKWIAILKEQERAAPLPENRDSSMSEQASRVTDIFDMLSKLQSILSFNPSAEIKTKRIVLESHMQGVNI